MTTDTTASCVVNALTDVAPSAPLWCAVQLTVERASTGSHSSWKFHPSFAPQDASLSKKATTPFTRRICTASSGTTDDVDGDEYRNEQFTPTTFRDGHRIAMQRPSDAALAVNVLKVQVRRMGEEPRPVKGADRRDIGRGGTLPILT